MLDLILPSNFSLSFVYYSTTYKRLQLAFYLFSSCYVQSYCPLLFFWFTYTFLICVMYTASDCFESSRLFFWQVCSVSSIGTSCTFMSLDKFTLYRLFSGVEQMFWLHSLWRQTRQIYHCLAPQLFFFCFAFIHIN